MIGETIYVGPDETLDSVACIWCSIRVEGTVRDGALLVLGNLENNGTIEGDAVVIAGNVDSSGHLGGSALLILSRMQLRSKVGGGLIAVMGEVEFRGSEAVISGDLLTVAAEISNASPDSIGGAVKQVGGDAIGRILIWSATGVFVGLTLGALLVLTAMNVLAYAILGKKRLTTIADTLGGNAMICFLLGLGTCFALVVIGLVAAMLLPISLPLLFVLVVLLLVGYSGVTFGIGRNLFGRLKPLTATIAATVLLVIIQMVPLVGWLIMAIVANIAIGAAVQSGFGTSTNWLNLQVDGGSWRPRAAD